MEIPINQMNHDNLSKASIDFYLRHLKMLISASLVGMSLTFTTVPLIADDVKGGDVEYYSDSLSNAVAKGGYKTSGSTSLSAPNTAELASWSLVLVLIVILFITNWISFKKLHSMKMQKKDQDQRFAELKQRYLRSQNYLKVLAKRLDAKRQGAAQPEEDNKDGAPPQGIASKEIAISESIAMAHLTAGIVDEITTPLGFVHNGVETLKLTLKDMIAETTDLYAQTQRAVGNLDEQARNSALALEELSHDAFELMDSIEDGASRLMNIVKKLRIFNSLSDDSPQLVNINDSIDEVLAVLREQTDGRIELRRFYDAPMSNVFLPPGQVSHIFINILLNAIQAIKSDRTDGVITIYTEGGPESSIIRIHDNGVGMSKQTMSKVFQPYFTTKSETNASGLGLSICYGIVKENNGDLIVRSVEGQGTEFEIVLPATSKMKTHVS